jgi:hypothetical protein
MSSFKKIDMLRGFAAGVYLSEDEDTKLHYSRLPLLYFSFLKRFTFSVWVTWTFSVT